MENFTAFAIISLLVISGIVGGILLNDKSKENEINRIDKTEKVFLYAEINEDGSFGEPFACESSSKIGECING